MVCHQTPPVISQNEIEKQVILNKILIVLSLIKQYKTHTNMNTYNKEYKEPYVELHLA